MLTVLARTGQSYMHIKSKLEYEKYLDITEPITRSSLARLRTSSHRLAVETGRYTKNKLPRKDRHCKFCLTENQTEAEDNEMHVLVDCPLYASDRNICTNRIRELDTASPQASPNKLNNNSTIIDLLTGVDTNNIDSARNIIFECLKETGNIKMQLSLGRFITKILDKHKPYEEKRDRPRHSKKKKKSDPEQAKPKTK